MVAEIGRRDRFRRYLRSSEISEGALCSGVGMRSLALIGAEWIVVASRILLRGVELSLALRLRLVGMLRLITRLVFLFERHIIAAICEWGLSLFVHTSSSELVVGISIPLRSRLLLVSLVLINASRLGKRIIVLNWI